jgi:hypothetical protein
VRITSFSRGMLYFLIALPTSISETPYCKQVFSDLTFE